MISVIAKGTLTVLIKTVQLEGKVVVVEEHFKALWPWWGYGYSEIEIMLFWRYSSASNVWDWDVDWIQSKQIRNELSSTGFEFENLIFLSLSSNFRGV